MKLKAKQTPTTLLVVNVVLGVCVCLSGIMGAVGVWKNHIGSFVLSLVDLWILVMGLFLIFLEASKVRIVSL
jgi:hypothetical protein